MRPSYRKAIPVGELRDADIAAIMQAKVPPEHDYDYEDDPESGEDPEPNDSGQMAERLC